MGSLKTIAVAVKKAFGEIIDWRDIKIQEIFP